MIHIVIRAQVLESNLLDSAVDHSNRQGIFPTAQSLEKDLTAVGPLVDCFTTNRQPVFMICWYCTCSTHTFVLYTLYIPNPCSRFERGNVVPLTHFLFTRAWALLSSIILRVVPRRSIATHIKYEQTRGRKLNQKGHNLFYLTFKRFGLRV